MVLNQHAYANGLEYTVRTFFDGHVGLLARLVIQQIRTGPDVQDFWDCRHVVWRGLSGIRRRGPDEVHEWPLPSDAGMNTSSSINMIFSTCNGSLGGINPMTRVQGLYSLAHIAVWLCDYIDLYSEKVDEAWLPSMCPFYSAEGGATGLLYAAVDMIWGILYTMPIGERELLTKEIYHVRIMHTLHLLKRDLDRSEERRDNFIFKRYGTWMDCMPLG